MKLWLMWVLASTLAFGVGGRVRDLGHWGPGGRRHWRATPLARVRRRLRNRYGDGALVAPPGAPAVDDAVVAHRWDIAGDSELSTQYSVIFRSPWVTCEMRYEKTRYQTC
jgi:hypothetical protein